MVKLTFMDVAFYLLLFGFWHKRDKKGQLEGTQLKAKIHDLNIVY